MTDILEQVEECIQDHRLFRERQAILVAVSGGLDSMVLLEVLHSLSSLHGWKLTVAHLNHRLRGRASNSDEALVRRTAKKLHLPFVAERAQVRGFAKAQKLSLEMAARKLRHEFLARTAVKLHIRTIAVAHHADDQLELFFLRLLRGTGGRALAGMKWRNPSPSNERVGLVRPLLDLPKAALKEFAIGRKIEFREDASNTCLEIQRNRIRHELIPLLLQNYQPALRKTAIRVMDIVGAEADFVTQVGLDWLRRMLKSGKDAVIASPTQLTSFSELPLAVQRRVLQLQLDRFGISAAYDLVEKLRRAPLQPVAVAAALNSEKKPEPSVARCVSRDQAGLLQWESPSTAKFQTASLNLNFAGKRGEVLFAGVRIRWRIEPYKGTKGLSSRRNNREYFDADKVGLRVLLRHWQPGNRFQPIGTSTPIKLQDLFTNNKVSRARRHQVLVAEAENGELFWVEGLRMAERFKLSRQTRQRLTWDWERLKLAP